jgi:hypothetical protein
MSKRNVRTPVPAKFIRAAARNGEVTVTDAALDCVLGGPQGRGRGRLNKDLIAAFEAENPAYVYAGEKSDKEVKSVTLDLTKPNARGARLKRPETVAISEVRKRAGVVGKVGRLSKADLSKAADSIMRERGWL